MRAIRVCVWLLCFVGIGLPAAAQTAVTASSGIGNITSADHAAMNVDGSLVITKYEVRFLPGAGCAPIAPFDAGKPPLVGGVLTIKPIPSMGSLTANCPYTAVVAAIGPGGEGVSPASDPFVRVVAKVPAAPSKPAVVP